MNYLDSYDVAIIGAGVAGLISGCYLAKNGYRCVILEAHEIPGGCSQGFSRSGYYFDAGAHLFGSISKTGLLNNILNSIDFEHEFIMSSPMDRIHFNDRTISIPATWEGYQQALCRSYPQYESEIIKFMELLIYIAKYAGARQVYQKYGDMPYRYLLDQFRFSDEIKNIYSCQWGFLGEKPNQVSALAMAVLMVSYIRDGAGYPKGGAQRFCNRLANKFRSLGGKILLSTEVNSASLDGDRVISLGTKIGKSISAKQYISTIHPTCLLNIMGKPNDHCTTETRSLGPGEYLKKSISIYAAFIGARINADEYYGRNGWYYESNVDGSLDSWVYVFSPTLYDKTLAPDEASTLELAFVYENIDGKTAQARAITRAECKKKIMLFLDKYFPEVSNKIEIFQDAMPETYVKYTKNPDGAIYGWAPSAKTFRDRVHFDKQKICDNVTQAGHWAMPGPGIPAVSISGVAAAKKVITSLNRCA